MWLNSLEKKLSMQDITKWLKDGNKKIYIIIIIIGHSKLITEKYIILFRENQFAVTMPKNI